MTLIITCGICRRTSAVNNAAFLREQEQRLIRMIWSCPRCTHRHVWEYPLGRRPQTVARQSLKNSNAYERSVRRKDVYRRLRESPPEAEGKILFGELLWWWREEAGLTRERAAEAAGISVRQWQRIEEGQSRPSARNVVGIAHAVGGIVDQAYMLLGPFKTFFDEFGRRMKEQEARIQPGACLQKDAEDQVLSPSESPDVEVALKELRRVLAAEFDEDHFLFYAHMIHQEYWGKRWDILVVADDLKSRVIPPARKLIDIVRLSPDLAAARRAIIVIAREAKFWMPKDQIAGVVWLFIWTIFTPAAGERETRRRIGEKEWTKLGPLGQLVLSLFDQVGRERQPLLLRSCLNLYKSEKDKEQWFREKEPRKDG